VRRQERGRLTQSLIKTGGGQPDVLSIGGLHLGLPETHMMGVCQMSYRLVIKRKRIGSSATKDGVTGPAGQPDAVNSPVRHQQYCQD